MIPKDQLVAGQWYEGDGRLGPLALWTGKIFVAPNYKWKQWELGEMLYERGFMPVRLFTPTIDLAK